MVEAVNGANVCNLTVNSVTAISTLDWTESWYVIIDSGHFCYNLTYTVKVIIVYLILLSRSTLVFVKKKRFSVSVSGLTTTTQLYLRSTTLTQDLTLSSNTVECTHRENFTVNGNVTLEDGPKTIGSISSSSASLKFYQKGLFLCKANDFKQISGSNAAITSLMIGDEIIVEIDYGRSLNQQLQLELDKVIVISCHIAQVRFLTFFSSALSKSQTINYIKSTCTDLSASFFLVFQP